MEIKEYSKSLSEAVTQGAEELSKALTIIPSPFEWIRIPAGHVNIDYGQTRGEVQFLVSEFYIGKYPIANAQYRILIAAEDGY
jgi:hypothetical protein